MDRYPQLDRDAVVDSAAQSRLGLPLWVMLEDLANELQAPIPDVVLNVYTPASLADEPPVYHRCHRVSLSYLSRL